jgi:hypothetical protein
VEARGLSCRYYQIISHVGFAGSDMSVKAHCSHGKPRKGALIALKATHVENSMVINSCVLYRWPVVFVV